MTCLLCLSPTLLDQSFPRSADEARRVGAALGEIQSCLETDSTHLVITEPLGDLVEMFEWNRTDLNETAAILQIIYSLLTQWFLQPHEKIVQVFFPNDIEYTEHPIPKNTDNSGFVEVWAEEVGKLLSLHELECSHRDKYFIGVACDFAFAGEDLGKYDNISNEKVFPLIGPLSLNTLLSAYAPVLPHGIRNVSVSFRDAYKNCFALGAIAVENPPGGSHYKVRFPDASRPWELDSNTDPLPERFLRELIPLTGYSLEEYSGPQCQDQKSTKIRTKAACQSLSNVSARHALWLPDRTGLDRLCQSTQRIRLCWRAT